MGIVRSISDALEPIEFPDSMTEADVDAYVSQNRDSLRAKLIARAQAQNAAETEAEETLRYKRGEMGFGERLGSDEYQLLRDATSIAGTGIEYLGRLQTQGATFDPGGDFTPGQREAMRNFMAGQMARNPEAVISSAPTVQAGRSISQFAEENFVPLPGAEESLRGQVAGGLGSVAALVPATALAGPAGAGILYGLSAGQSAVDDVEQTFEPRIAAARNLGDMALVAALEQEKYRAKNIVGPIGAVTGGVSEAALGVAGRVFKAGGPGKRIAEYLAGQAAGRLKRTAAGAAGGMATEAAQETTEQFLGNVAAQAVYDPERQLTEGLAESAVVGGLTGGLVGGAGGGIRGPSGPGRAREVADPTPDNPLPLSRRVMEDEEADLTVRDLEALTPAADTVVETAAEPEVEPEAEPEVVTPIQPDVAPGTPVLEEVALPVAGELGDARKLDAVLFNQWTASPESAMDPMADGLHEAAARTVSEEARGRFTAHGMRGLDEATLSNIINNGLTQGDEGPVIGEGVSGLNTKSNAPLIVLSKPDQTIRSGGIGAVVVNRPWADRLIPVLQARHPSVLFIGPADLPAYLNQATASSPAADPVVAAAEAALEPATTPTGKDSSQVAPPVVAPAPVEAAAVETPAPAPVLPDDTAMEAATLAAGQPAAAAAVTTAPDAGIAERTAADAAMVEATRRVGETPAAPALTTAPEEGVQAVVEPVPVPAPAPKRPRPRIANKPQGPKLKGKPTPAPKDPATMKAAEINKELDRLDSQSETITGKLIEAGRGRELSTETLQKTDPLSLEAKANFERRSELRSEIEARYGPNPPSRLPAGRKAFGPRTTAPAPAQPDRILNALDAAIKATDSSGTVYSDPFLINALGRPLLNAALRAARAVYKATRQLAAARAAAWKHVQDNAPEGADLTGVKERLDAAVKPVPQSITPDRKETEGFFTGENPTVPANSDANWTANAKAFVDNFNGDLQAAYVEALKPKEFSGIDDATLKYIMADILMRASKVVSESKNPVEVGEATRLMRMAADTSKNLASKSGADLGASALIKEKLEYLAPMLSWMGLIRKQQARLPFPEIDSDALRKWLKDARAGAIKGVIQDTAKADNVVAREFKKAARELKINWRDVMEASLKQQGKVKAAIAAEIRKHPELSKLSPEATVELANLLGRQWEQERNKILRAEFGKAVGLPKVTEDTREKIFRALPKIIRLANLGILDNEAFRNAVAPEFGVQSITQESVAELTAMAQKAQDVGGVNRNRIIQDMYRKMAREGGVSWGDILRDYWYASVLSGTRTQVDNMLNVLNGALNGMFMTMLSGKDAGTTARAWAKGTKAGVKEFLPIVIGGQLYLSKQYNPELSGSAMEGIAESENLFKRALSNAKFVSRLMIALDHITASGSEQAAISYALSRRFGKEELDRFMKPTKEVLALAKQRALNEGTPPDLMNRRIQEIVQETVPFEVLQVAADIRAESTYTQRPKGLMGVFYDMILAADEAMEKQGYPKLFRFISGTQFARFAGNMTNAYLNYVPPVALLRYWRSNPKAQFMRWDLNSEEQRNMLLMKAAFGTALAATAAALFLGDDEEERDIDIVGTLKSLDPAKRKQLMAQGVMPYSIKIGDKYYSYRQMEFGGILAGIAELRDRQRWDPKNWNKENIAEKFRDFSVAGMFIIKDSSAISGFAEFLGFANAYKVDAEALTEKAVPRFVSRLAGSVIPNIAKEIDAWGDPSLYKANTFTEFFMQQVPYWRREVGPGPMANILGDPIRVERYPWSRWVREKPEDPEFQTLATLANRGVFLPMPAAAAEFVQGNERRPLTPAEMYQYETRVGKRYREFIRQNGSQLLRMAPEDADKFIKARTQPIRARELQGVRSKLKM